MNFAFVVAWWWNLNPESGKDKFIDIFEEVFSYSMSPWRVLYNFMSDKCLCWSHVFLFVSCHHKLQWIPEEDWPRIVSISEVTNFVCFALWRDWKHRVHSGCVFSCVTIWRIRIHGARCWRAGIPVRKNHGPAVNLWTSLREKARQVDKW